MKNKLKFYRTEAGLSQLELAEVTGVPRYVIQLAEQNIKLPNVDNIQKLEELFGKKVFDSDNSEGGRDD